MCSSDLITQGRYLTRKDSEEALVVFAGEVAALGYDQELWGRLAMRMAEGVHGIEYLALVFDRPAEGLWTR